jgi:hypothetical protein
MASSVKSEGDMGHTFDIAFIKFSDSLIPTDEYLSEGKDMVQKVLYIEHCTYE